MTRRLRRAGAPWRLLAHEYAGREPGHREGANGHAHHVTSTPGLGGTTPDSPWSTTHVLPPTEFDELAVGNWLHIEQMDVGSWWMTVGGVVINLTADRDGRPTSVTVHGPGDHDEPAPGCVYEHIWTHGKADPT